MKKNSNGKSLYWQQVDKPTKQLLAEFSKLLGEDLPEQAYQLFMEANTRLIPREFVQNHGIHFSLVLRKLAFGADYKSDFAYLSKSSDDWNCVLVEIERPGAKFFRKGANDFHPDFLKGLQQINKWRAWFNNSANKTSFAENTVGLIRVPLEENPIYPRFVLVHGRRSEYYTNQQRRSLVAAQEKDDFKILTFDSLMEDTESKLDLYLGVRKNEYIDLKSDVFLSESMFAWMSPDQIRIGDELRANALKLRDQWHHVRSFKEKDKVMDFALARVRRRPKQRA
jgi:Domain of unknown function (DUF4263)